MRNAAVPRRSTWTLGSMRHISLFLLWLEALALGFVTVFFILSMTFLHATDFLGLANRTSRPVVAVDIVSVLGLVCGWRLLCTYLLIGQDAAKRISLWWWGAAYGTAAV